MDALDLPQPEIEGDIGVARRQVRVVIARLAVERIAAVGLDCRDELAVAREAQGEMSVADGRVILRRAPRRHDLGAGVWRRGSRADARSRRPIEMELVPRRKAPRRDLRSGERVADVEALAA